MRKNVAIVVAAATAATGSCSDVYTQHKHNLRPEIETIKIIASVFGLNCS